MGVIINVHRTVDGVEEKRCGMCHEFKPLTGFYRNTRAWDGLSTICRECALEKKREWNRIYHPGKRGRRIGVRHVTLPDGSVAKMCPKCMEGKPLGEFHIKRDHWDGRDTVCKVCSRAYSKKRYKNICLQRWAQTTNTKQEEK